MFDPSRICEINFNYKIISISLLAEPSPSEIKLLSSNNNQP
jgi:hypothetical protein